MFAYFTRSILVAAAGVACASPGSPSAESLPTVAATETPPPAGSPAGPVGRSPRPKFDYTKLRIRGASKFAGRTIKVQLAVDTSGRVHQVQLLQGVDRELDRRTVALVHSFEFEPARDETGAPIPGTSRWDIQIVEDEDEKYQTGVERGRR